MKASILSLALLAGVSAQTITSGTTQTLPAQFIGGTTFAPQQFVGATTLPATTTVRPTTTTIAAQPQIQYIQQQVQPQIQYVQAAPQQQIQYVQAAPQQQIQYVQVQPQIPVPTFPQPAAPKRLSGACYLVDQALPSAAPQKGTIVYAVSVRELPSCLVLNRENCSQVSGAVPSGSNYPTTSDKYKQTQYAQCKAWRALTANVFKPTAASCRALSQRVATAGDEFVKADIAACKAADTPFTVGA